MAAISDDAALVEILERLALEAGRAIMRIRDAGFAIEAKADFSPVTEADRQGEAIILRGLAEAFPTVDRVAEEEVAVGRCPVPLGDEFFLIDALDGTREFVKGGDDFTVNIGLVRNGEPVAGVVYAPARGRLWSGAGGRASRLDVSADHEPRQRTAIAAGTGGGPCMTVVASRSHNTPETDAYLDTHHPSANLVSVGSSLKFCLVASGEADVYPRFGRTMEWDTAAGDAILRAAGGTMLCADGSAFLYGKREQAGEADFANPWFIATGAPPSR